MKRNKNKMETFWDTMNCAFSAKERNDFNKWQTDMYLRFDSFRDAVLSLSMVKLNGMKVNEHDRFISVMEKFLKLHNMVAKIPNLCK